MSYIIPVIEPHKLMRDQTMGVATLADLRKAVQIARDGGPTLIPQVFKRGEHFPSWATHPDVHEVVTWLDEHKHLTLALDLETTYSGQIMCCGLWPVEGVLEDQGLCIPFAQRGGRDYWSILQGLKVKEALFDVLTSPSTRIVGQNAAGFDVPMMRKAWGINVKLVGDTMIAHSLCMPELPHGLAFLSSVFTHLSPYKHEFGESKEAKDDVDKWERVQDMDDMELRVYNILDAFATAVVWGELEKMMESP
jgi:hypothetical protein